MKTKEFILFIQSIGFVYERHSFDKEYFTMDQYEIRINHISFTPSYRITETVHKGVTRTLTTNSISRYEDDLDIFRNILRDKRLKDLGI